MVMCITVDQKPMELSRYHSQSVAIEYAENIKVAMPVHLKVLDMGDAGGRHDVTGFKDDRWGEWFLRCCYGRNDEKQGHQKVTRHLEPPFL
jgi:hypothetical protein